MRSLSTCGASAFSEVASRSAAVSWPWAFFGKKRFVFTP
jgi:hypothetical protein